MRAYKVSATVEECSDDGRPHVVTKFAGTQADARTARQAIVDEHGVKKKDVALDEIEIPTDKAGLLGFVNNLVGG